MQSGLLGFANEFSATCVRLLAYIGGIVVLAGVGAKVLSTPAVQAAINPSPRAQWADAGRPLRAFTASVPGFAEGEPDYAIRRNTRGGGRKDIMSWGPAWNDPAGVGSRLLIEIYRPGTEIARFGDAASEVTARTAELGGPYALTPADAIESKFGHVATFSFTAQSAGQARNCIGFSRSFNDPLVEIAGWYCKGAAEVVERGTLACALEKLSLLMAASEPKIAQLFANAELRRKTCGTQPARTKRASNARRHDWIDARKTPKLRGRVATR